MRGVKCKICGHEHPGVAHIWDDEPKRQTVPPKVTARKPEPPKPIEPPVTKRGRGRPPTGFDKKTYQRELMRKRRASGK